VSVGQAGIAGRFGSRPEGLNCGVLGSAGVGGGAVVLTGEIVFTWSTGRCWRGEEDRDDVASVAGSETGNTPGASLRVGEAVSEASR
jgi:hypothetical protein